MTDRSWSALLDPRSGAGDDRLRRVVDGFARRRAPAPAHADHGYAHWGSDFHRLDRVPLFTRAEAALQQSVLQACGEHLLWESCYIEQSGIAFCARMVLHAEDVPTRKLYSLIGADEATHEHWIGGWLRDSARRPADPFNLFVAGLVEGGEPQPLCYVLQVVLEGFGIQHYRRLAEGCREPALATTLRTMMSDEGLHHAGGVAAFDAARLDRPGRALVLEATAQLLHMMRSGPQAVVSVLECIFGGLDSGDAAQVFAQLDCERDSTTKLGALRELIAQPGMSWLLEELERLRLFTPCTPAECGQVLVATRN